MIVVKVKSGPPVDVQPLVRLEAIPVARLSRDRTLLKDTRGSSTTDGPLQQTESPKARSMTDPLLTKTATAAESRNTRRGAERV